MLLGHYGQLEQKSYENLNKYIFCWFQMDITSVGTNTFMTLIFTFTLHQIIDFEKKIFHYFVEINIRKADKLVE